MQLRTYMLLAICAFLVATTGGDLSARTTIAGNTFGQAFTAHIQWASSTFIGVLLLFLPFAGVAYIAFNLQKLGKIFDVFAIFLLSVTILVYFYFRGFSGSQLALVEGKWTASALEIGLLPFFVGIPLLLVMQVGGRIILRLINRLENG